MQSSGESPHGGRTTVPGAWLAGAVVLVAAAAIATFLLTAALRITYPYELEWMEGGVLDHITRLRAGQPIYVEPTFRFVPLIYPPLYYCLASLVMPITGDGFLGPRLVSLAASLGSMGVIFLLVRRETGNRIAALCAAGLYAASYPVVDGWFDVARVDGLLLLFVLSGAYLMRQGDRAGSSALAGLLLTCAFLTKQSAVVFAAPLLLFHLLWYPRRFPVLLATSVIPCALISAVLHWRTGGWYTYYVFSLPGQHAWVPPAQYLQFWLEDLRPYVLLALPLIVILAAARWKTRRRQPAWDFYAALALGGFAVSWLSRLHTGGGVNVILPVLATIAVLFGLAMATLPQLIDALQQTGTTARRRLKAAVVLAALCQLLLLLSAFNPWHWVPTDADRQAGDELVGRIREFQGDVIVPSAPYLARRAGKPTMAHHMAILDVLRTTGNPRIKQKLIADVGRQLRNPRCDAIFLFWSEGWFQDTPIPDEYLFTEELIRSRKVFRPKTGAEVFVPVYLFIRQGRRPADTEKAAISAS